MEYDFSGWATRNDVKCSDGRVIRKNAFMHNDGQVVPLVWNHQHHDVANILGHAKLENRNEGVYAYCKFNDSENGQTAKELVQHGDVQALSIYANQLKQQGPDVIHGAIREVSLVLAGANPKAFIEEVIRHGEASEDEAIIFTGEDISVKHAEETINRQEAKSADEVIKHQDAKSADEETVADVFNTLSEKQKTVVYAMIGQALENNSDENEEEEDMKHNVFDKQTTGSEELIHADVAAAVFNDAKRYGTLKESALAHGIEQIGELFPDARTTTNVPEMITRDMGWVQRVMASVHRTPFSRIKSIFADLTEEDARAKGYLKGKLKKEQVFSLLKRTTTPVTIYKKQKLDRDDVIDITDFDVVAWLKAEMRFMLDEEIARAVLVGDGRLPSSDDHINELNIRPIWKDEELYTINATIDGTANNTPDKKAKAFIRAVVKSRKDYKGTGNPTLFTTEDVLTDCLLMEDNTGRIIYDTEAKLATALRVKEIITVPVMENQTREVGNNNHELMALIVNLNDYNIGADKGGAVNLFDDFDIDYNAQKYLIETRCSGALIKPYSAIAVESVTPKA